MTDQEASLEKAKAAHRQGRLGEAQALYRAVLQAEPRNFDALFLLSAASLQAGDPTAALEAGLQAQAADPASAVARHHLGEVFSRLGRWADALGAYDAALDRDPAFAASHRGRARALRALGRKEEALASYDAALTVKPDDAEVHNSRGNTLMDLGRAQEALASFDAVLALDPAAAVAHSNRGHALIGLDRPAEAVEALDAALALDPGSAAAHYNRGLALMRLERPEAALAGFDAALAIDPGYAEAHNNRGKALLDLERPEAALEAFEAALALKPDDADFHFNRGLALLTLRRFAEAWPEYEHRWDSAGFVARAAGQVTPAFRAVLTRWPKPEDVAGRRVLVVAEQGVGDELMFAGMIPDLAAQAASVTLVCEPRLRRLFARAFPGVQIAERLAARAELDRFDTVLALGGLGGLYRKEPKDFPGRPYLAPSPEARARWAARLGPKTGRRIGLSWRGGTAATRRSGRSLPLAELVAGLGLADCELVSLQYGDVAEAAGGPVRVFPAEEIADFEDLAALVLELDAVVSVQTALVHLCGAIGAPCRVLLPQAAEWRYGATGDAMPWYDSVRLFRQEAPGGWAPVLRRIRESLA